MLWNTLHCLHKLISIFFSSHRCFCTFDLKVVLPRKILHCWNRSSESLQADRIWLQPCRGGWVVKTYAWPPVLKQSQWPPPTRYWHSCTELQWQSIFLAQNIVTLPPLVPHWCLALVILVFLAGWWWCSGSTYPYFSFKRMFGGKINLRTGQKQSMKICK